MNSIPDDELISAYLDNELSEAERARVESMLRELPEARQMLEDLRALRSGFEGLKSHRLDDAFADRVLRSAERELLAGDPPGVKLEHVDGEPTELRLASRDGADHEIDSYRHSAPQGWQRFRRPLAWAGLALAAGVLLMVFDRNPQGMAPQGGQVAVAPLPAGPANAEWRAPGGIAPLAGEKTAETAPRDAREPLPANKRAERSKLAVQAADDRFSAGEAAPAPSAAKSSTMERRSAVAAKGATPATDGLERMPARAGALGGGAGAAVARGLGGKAGQARAANMFFAYELERLQDGKLVAEPLDDKTLIVWCDVDNDVADRPEFRQLLTSNGIAWEPDGDESGKLNELRAEKQEPKQQKAKTKSGRFQLSDAKDAAAVEQKLSEGELTHDILQRAQVVAEALNQADSDYVLLEAPAEQLQGVLEEIDRRPELFLSVNIEPAPAAPEQQAYAAYNRGRAANEPMQIERARKLAKQSQALLGRAQRVTVLPQLAEQAGEEEAGLEKAAGADQPTPDRQAGGNSLRRMKNPKPVATESLSEKTPAPLPAPSVKPAAKPEGDAKAENASADAETPAGYQQALFIFRRVRPPAAAAPAKADD